MSVLDRVPVPAARRPPDALASRVPLAPPAGTHARPGVRLMTFAALGIYGALRWGTLTNPSPGLRLTAMVLLAVALAGLGSAAPAIYDRAWHGGWHRVSWMFRGWGRRTLALLLALISLCVVLALAGVPVSWIAHLRVATIANGVGQGLSALPGVLLPYLGINSWIRIVMNCGAGLLLLGAALTMCTRSPSEVRRVAAALQLAALAVIPATVMHPALPYVQGLLLFLLVAAFLWGERVVSGRSGAALAVVGVAALGSLLIAPALARHHPWFNYRSLTASLSPSHVDAFDWKQSYGPYTWPRDGRTVMTVRAHRADYWKAENLDIFTGVAWAQGEGTASTAVPAPSSGALRRWTQTITVTIEAMRTTQVIAAGAARRPAHIDAPLRPGVSAGTWVAGSALAPGSSYSVSTYSPRPSSAQLNAIPASEYPDAALANYRVLGLPSQGAAYPSPQIEFPPFHASGPALNMTSPFGAIGDRLIRNSPYARAYALATELADNAATPYAFVTAVEHYLAPSNGFAYDEQVSSRTYPLEAFLFATRRGYCQQFAGAMALLLRMGGVPARVATGFTSGIFDSTEHEYLISDRDAHAWVEVWFPRYGWVRFDPTPATAPAIASVNSGVTAQQGRPRTVRRHVTSRRNASSAGRSSQHGASGRSSSPPVVAIVLPVLALLALGGLGALWLRGARPAAEDLVAELERALARSGRPAAGGLTLHSLERRFHSSPAAARYVRRLRLARYGEREDPPTGPERRALRAQLAAGLGVAGWIRAWWALPPRRPGRRPA